MTLMYVLCVSLDNDVRLNMGLFTGPYNTQTIVQDPRSLVVLLLFPAE